MTSYPSAPFFTPAHPTDSTDFSSSAGVAAANRPSSSLNLNDIFGDCFFTPEGEAVFMNDQQDAPAVPSTESNPTQTRASRLTSDGNAIPVANAAGISSTNLDKPGMQATVMGATAGREKGEPRQAVPMQYAPQRDHHLGYVIPEKKSRKKGDRKMSEQQKNERRERNREHAKRSRIRKKFLLESLQQSVSLLKEENEKLRGSIKQHLGEETSKKLLSQRNLEDTSAGLIATGTNDANKVLDDPDFSFIKALQTAQQNFVVTDPSLPDNPIVYATQGFLNLTGYTLDQVLGRNCRFLQGPETDPKAVEKIRKSIEDGTDMSVCLLNYRADGTTFWNQFFIAALRDAAGSITNYVGVQCKVSDQYAATVCKRQDEEEEKGDGGEDEDED